MLGDAAPVEASVCGRRSWRGSADDLTSPGEQAAAALVAIGTRAFQPVLDTLKSPVWIARRNAAWYVDTTIDYSDPDMDQFWSDLTTAYADQVQKIDTSGVPPTTRTGSPSERPSGGLSMMRSVAASALNQSL